LMWKRFSIKLRRDVNSMFVPLREKTDRMGLELRKSLCGKALRIFSTESIVTKRVALGGAFQILGISETT
jgi:hypothetical protein